MTPHLGQGACQAIEDAVVLASVRRNPRRACPDLAAYTSARMRRTRMVADGSYRASRLSGMTSRPAIVLRNAGIRLAGRLAPGLMIRQLDQIASWTPPAVGASYDVAVHVLAALPQLRGQLGGGDPARRRAPRTCRRTGRCPAPRPARWRSTATSRRPRPRWSMRRVISGRTGHGTRRQMSEATTPGCSAYVVTPVPAVRRASSCAEQHVAQLGDRVLVQAGDAALRPAQRLEVDAVGRVVGVAGHRHHPGRRAAGQAAEQGVRQREVAEVIDPEHQLEALLGQAARPGPRRRCSPARAAARPGPGRPRRMPAPNPGRPGRAAGRRPRRSRSRP